MNRRLPSLACRCGLGTLALLPSVFIAPLLAATPPYSIRSWQTADGLPENSVNAVVQTRDGYLWLGTYSGLVRFDGVRFTAFDSETTPELKTSRITSLYEDPAGTLWIGQETGELTCLKAGTFKTVEVPARSTGGKTIVIRADQAGAIWLLTKEGLLARVPDGRLIPPKPGQGAGGGVFTMARDRQGKLWVAHHGELGTVEGGQFQPCAFEQTEATGYVQAICASHDGGVWILNSGRVRKWRDGQWRGDLGTGPWSVYAVTAVAETARGELAVGTSDQGLYLLSADAPLQHFNRTNGLGSDWVRCVCEDREGNLWLGVGNNGLNVLRTVNFERFDPPDHWKDCAVLAVNLGRDGGLWLGTEGAGLYHFHEGHWSQFGEAEGLGSKFVWSVLEDAQGRLWAGTWGGGLFLRQADHFTVAPSLEGVIAPMTALFQSRDGELWVGTGSGLLRYETNHPDWFGGGDGLIKPDVRAVTEDADGAIWFGMSGGGLGCLKAGKLKIFTKRDGLPSDFVLCLRPDTDGSLWIGTFGGGLCRLKQGHFAKISTREGLANNVIHHLEEDGQGDCWMSSQRGILRVSKRALNDCADGVTNRVPCDVYGVGDGLETAECSGGFQPAGCKTPDGRLWFPTRKGLVAVDPLHLQTNTLAPPVYIEELLVDGQSQKLASHSAFPAPHSAPEDSAFRTSHSTIQVAPGRQRFEFHFTALSLTAPEKVCFKYRLAGLESEWVDARTRRSAEYSYLPPGNYTFSVIACNNDRVWNEQGATLAFTVLPFFWQTWWFQGLAYLGAAVTVGGSVLFITRRRHQLKFERLERAQALERERARIAKDIHDDLGASLTRITMLSQSASKALDQPQQAAAHLDVIYRTGRALTLAMDEIVWAVNPKHDTLDSLVTYLVRFAQDYLGPADIRCRLDLPLQLPTLPLTSEVRHNLFLAFKEALHNVVKHADASEVVISLSLEPLVFRLSVADNGRGCLSGEANEVHAPDNNRPAGGNGLDNMRRRLQDLGGHCRIDSKLAQGTEVTFKVPIRSTILSSAH